MASISKATSGRASSLPPRRSIGNTATGCITLRRGRGEDVTIPDGPKL